MLRLSLFNNLNYYDTAPSLEIIYNFIPTFIVFDLSNEKNLIKKELNKINKDRFLIPFSTHTGLEFNDFSAYNESLLPLALESINKVSEVNQKKLLPLDEEGHIKYLDKYEMSNLLSNNDIENSIKKNI